jgi:hypothetical protein
MEHGRLTGKEQGELARSSLAGIGKEIEEERKDEDKVGPSLLLPQDTTDLSRAIRRLILSVFLSSSLQLCEHRMDAFGGERARCAP